MNIIVDIDGVIAALHTEWLARYNRDWDDCLKVESITDWDTHKFVKPECGRVVYNYLFDEDLYDNVKSIPGALKGVQTLRNMGFRLLFVTVGNADAKLSWLIENKFLTLGDGMLGHPDYVCCTDKSLIKASIIIDDNPHVLGMHPAWHILYDQPWNRHVAMARAKDWDDVVAKVRFLRAALAESNNY